jgi:hypothetical protein
VHFFDNIKKGVTSVRRSSCLAALALIFVSVSFAEEIPVDTVLPDAPIVVAEPKPEDEGAIVIIEDSLPDGAVIQGVWEWDASQKYSGEKSHTGPASKGLIEHSYRAAPVVVPEGYLLEQYFYLYPNNIPSGIMLRFTYELDSKEGEIGVYKEGEEEVFVFNDDEPVIYEGTLPEPGKWEKWTIDPNDLGLKGAKLTGISFVVYGGKADWDLTRFVPLKKPTK